MCLQMFICICPYVLVLCSCLYIEFNGPLVQDQLTDYIATFCPVISLRVTEAEQLRIQM